MTLPTQLSSSEFGKMQVELGESLSSGWMVGGWMTMATVLTNTQSVVMVEEITSVDATLTLTVPSKLSPRHRILKSPWDLMFNF